MRKILWLAALIGTLCLCSCTPADGGNQPADETASDTAVTDGLPQDSTDENSDPIPAPPAGTLISVRYEVNNKTGGSLSGDTAQTIRYGVTKTSEVIVQANLGYRFVGWSDGSDSVTRGGDCPKADTVYTAVFAYDVLELPIVSLTTETHRDVASKTQYIDGTIAITGCDEEYMLEELDMEIRGRGNSSWDMMEKKSYRIKLSQKQNLLGLGEDEAKSWVLLANHADQSLLRNHITMEFARKLDGIAFMPASASVDLYLNGEYRGVYLLCEQIEVNHDRVDISENPESLRTGYFFEMSYYATDPQFSVGSNQYEIKNDLSSSDSLKAEQIAYIQTVVQRCYTAVERGDEELIRSLIDVPSAVDTYIVEELFKNKDDGWDSFYMYYDAAVEGEVLHFGPVWDFDLSGGNTDAGAETYDGLWAGVSECITDNEWFIELIEQEWFRRLVQERWNELKRETDLIPGKIRTEAMLHYNAYSRNFEKWPIFGQWINQQPPQILALKNYTDHYNYYAKWMQDRIAWLNNCFNSASFIFDGPHAEEGEP